MALKRSREWVFAPSALASEADSTYGCNLSGDMRGLRRRYLPSTASMGEAAPSSRPGV